MAKNPKDMDDDPTGLRDFAKRIDLTDDDIPQPGQVQESETKQSEANQSEAEQPVPMEEPQSDRAEKD
jgi:hypothetical protein